MSIKKDFSLMAILLIPAAVAINVVCGQIVSLLKLPIFLDTIGTILSACIAGPWVAAATGVLSNLFNGIFSPTALPYAFVSLCIGIVAGYLAKGKMYTKWWKVVISGVIIMLTATISSLPITYFVFGGAAGGGTSLITSAFLAMGKSLVASILSTSLISESSDKILSSLIAFFIIKGMSARYLSKFSLGHLYIKNATNEGKTFSA